MYVKLFNKILDSSIADNRKLRHFFIDLLLCSDADGNVVMTKNAIAKRTGASLDEVEWGLKELMKPEQGTGTAENDGRRVEALEGHGYGWRIINYSVYRDLKSANDLRAATNERVRRFREKKKSRKKRLPAPGEAAFVRAVDRGDGSENAILDAMHRATVERVEDKQRDENGAADV